MTEPAPNECDKCGTAAKYLRHLSMEPSDQPGALYPVGKYGAECFYIAAGSVRQQGHRPVDTETGREVFQRARS